MPIKFGVEEGTRNFKVGIGSLFDPYIWHDLHILLLPCDSPRYSLYACVIKVHGGKATQA